MPIYYSPEDLAQVAGLTSARIRQLVQGGQIRTAARTVGGRYLISETEVRRFLASRGVGQ